jgi:hypothetical protein
MRAPLDIYGWPTRDISLPDEVDDEVHDEHEELYREELPEREEEQ